MRFCLAALLLVSLSGCSRTTLNTGDGLTVRITLEPSQRFVIGSGAHAPLRASIRNLGETPADLVTVADDEQSLVSTLQPEESRSVELDADTALYIVNRSRSEASLQAELRGDTRVALRYEAID